MVARFKEESRVSYIMFGKAPNFLVTDYNDNCKAVQAVFEAAKNSAWRDAGSLLLLSCSKGFMTIRFVKEISKVVAENIVRDFQAFESDTKKRPLICKDVEVKYYDDLNQGLFQSLSEGNIEQVKRRVAARLGYQYWQDCVPQLIEKMWNDRAARINNMALSMAISVTFETEFNMTLTLMFKGNKLNSKAPEEALYKAISQVFVYLMCSPNTRNVCMATQTNQAHSLKLVASISSSEEKKDTFYGAVVHEWEDRIIRTEDEAEEWIEILLQLGSKCNYHLYKPYLYALPDSLNNVDKLQEKYPTANLGVPGMTPMFGVYNTRVIAYP